MQWLRKQARQSVLKVLLPRRVFSISLMARTSLLDKLRPIKWHDSDISEISLMIAAMLILWSLMLFYLDLDFASRIFLAFATAALSVWITLVVVKSALKEDRTRQWISVRSYTYSIILWHICLIACFSPLIMRESRPTLDQIQIIGHGHLYPGEDVTKALSRLPGLLKEDHISRERDDDARRVRGEDVLTIHSRDIAGLTQFYNMCTWRFEAIRITLIPRVLQLSDDRDVFNALLRYETKVEEFEDIMRQPMGASINGAVIERLANLIESSALVYEALREKTPGVQELERLMEEPTIESPIP
jgi:hypothetical protein